MSIFYGECSYSYSCAEDKKTLKSFEVISLWIEFK
jgi:hypothetical protein